MSRHPHHRGAGAVRRQAAGGRVTAVAATAFLILGAVLATFVWLRGELASDLDRLGELHTAALTSELLGRPGSPQLRYAELGRLVTRFAEAPSVGRAAIAKVMRSPRLDDGGEREVVVAPAADGRRVLEDVTAGARRFAIDLGGDPDTPDAYLYLWPDTTRLDVVSGWIAVLSLLVLSAAGGAVWRARRRELLLERTSVELEAKRGELRRAERLAFVGQLAAGLLHDLRKPVNTIRAVASERLGAVADGGAGDERVDNRNDWEDVAAQTDLFHGLLRSTRFERFSQAGSVEPEWCDLADILDRSLDLVQCERRGVEVRRDFAPGIAALLRANPYELIQVFSNLVLNSYQALDGAGMLMIRLHPAGGRGDVAGVEVVIVDNGPGVPPEFVARLFEPFATTRLADGGSGLGTYIAREIVESLGGTLDLLPEPHSSVPPGMGGAAFRVWLPVSTSAEA
jgi:signal transduction histidine kinase